MPLLDDLAPRTIVLADKAYDSNAIRDLIERQGAVPNVQGPPALEKLLVQDPLQMVQRRRAHVLPSQGLPAHRHPLRQARSPLPRRPYPIVVMSPDAGLRRGRVQEVGLSYYPLCLIVLPCQWV